MKDHRRTSPEELLDRAILRANQAMWTIDLQCRRIREPDLMDKEFPGRKLADFDFLIVSLIRLVRAAKAVTREPEVKSEVEQALADFNESIPGLKKLRDVAEHFDDYIAGEGRDTSIKRSSLEVRKFNRNSLMWLGTELNQNVAYEASRKLFAALQEARKNVLKMVADSDKPGDKKFRGTDKP